MNILAFDPGFRNTGVAWYKDGTWGYKTLELKKEEKDITQGIRIILYEVEFIKEDGWDVVLIENFFGRGGISTQMLIGALIGIFSPWAEKIELLHPLRWTKCLFGKRIRDYKAAAMKYVKKRGPAPRTQHEADALCMIHYWMKFGLKDRIKRLVWVNRAD